MTKEEIDLKVRDMVIELDELQSHLKSDHGYTNSDKAIKLLIDAEHALEDAHIEMEKNLK